MPESYQELLKDIAPIDTPVQSAQAKTIDISGTLTGKSAVHGENYWSLLETVGEIESVGHGKVDYIARERASRQQALKHVAIGPAGAPAATEAPKSDLAAIAGDIASSIPILKGLKIQRVNTKELVLPNLSLADQIAELERIIEGLTENVFDKDHMDIVVLEVYGLRDAVKGFKKGVKRRGKPLSTLEQSLWSIRDQRISDAIALLENVNNQSKVNA